MEKSATTAVDDLSDQNKIVKTGCFYRRLHGRIYVGFAFDLIDHSMRTTGQCMTGKKLAQLLENQTAVGTAKSK